MPLGPLQDPLNVLIYWALIYDDLCIYPPPEKWECWHQDVSHEFLVSGLLAGIHELCNERSTGGDHRPCRVMSLDYSETAYYSSNYASRYDYWSPTIYSSPALASVIDKWNLGIRLWTFLWISPWLMMIVSVDEPVWAAKSPHPSESPVFQCSNLFKPVYG